MSRQFVRVLFAALAPPGIAALLLLVVMVAAPIIKGEAVSSIFLLIPVFIFYGIPAAYAIGILPSAAYALLMEAGYYFGLKERSWLAIGCSAAVCSLAAALTATYSSLWHPPADGRLMIALIGLTTGTIVGASTLRTAPKKKDAEAAVSQRHLSRLRKIFVSDCSHSQRKSVWPNI